MRTPVFELHIVPMIRVIDREHMRFAFDLWDYNNVVQNADLILARVATDMPPAANGGPWPEEWVTLFRRWKSSGFKRLELGAASYSWATSGSSSTVTAIGSYPTQGYRGWFHLEADGGSSRQYVLFFEAPETGGGGSTAFSIRERYPATDTRPVTVRDNTGVHAVH